MKKEPVYVLVENASLDCADVDSVRRRPKRKLGVSLRKPKLPETVILAILIWGIAVLSAYDKVYLYSRVQSRSVALEIFCFSGFARTWWLRGRMRSSGSTVRYGSYDMVHMNHIKWTSK